MNAVLENPRLAEWRKAREEALAEFYKDVAAAHVKFDERETKALMAYEKSKEGK